MASKTTVDADARSKSNASEDRIYQEIERDDNEEKEIQRKEIKDDEDEDLDGEGDVDETKSEREKWQNFESQYSLAIQQSVFVEREKWGNPVEFLLSCIASSVGLGNIWRFPFVAGENGGGAFLIPYILVVLIIANPLLYLELSWGQFCSGGPVRAWECAPIFKGVAYSQTVVSFCTVSFYMVIMCWTLLYLSYSFKNPLPWKDSPGKFFEVDHLKENLVDFKAGKGLGCPPDWIMLLSLMASWFIIWLVMVRGVKGSGKIAYFTALFPYVVLITLLVRGSMLDGADEGILFFLVPDFKKLTYGATWFQAVSQCFFSLGISFGGLVMFSSFNQFKHKLGRDVLIISFMDTFTSMLAGITMFGILGNLATSTLDEANKANYELDPEDESRVKGKAIVEGALTFVSGTFDLFVKSGKLIGPEKVLNDTKIQVVGKTVTGVEYAGFDGNALLETLEVIKVKGKAFLNGNVGNITDFITANPGFKILYDDKITLDVNEEPQHNDSVKIRIRKLAKGGAGLAFIAYPQALNEFGGYPAPQIFSVLFFFMILTLAIGSANGLVGNVVTVLCDRNPTSKRWKILTMVCFAGFFAGIMYTTPAGGKMLDLVDKHGSEFPLFVLAFCEIVGVAWVYGVKNITNDIEFMLDTRVFIWYQLCWGILIPFFLIFIFGFYLATFEAFKKWPLIGLLFGWLLSFVVLVIIPGVGIYTVFTRKSRFYKKKFLASINPSRKWGPKDPAIKEAWRRNRSGLPNEFACTTAVKNFFRRLFSRLVRRLFRKPIPPPRVMKQQQPQQDESNFALQYEISNTDAQQQEPGSPGGDVAFTPSASIKSETSGLVQAASASSQAK